ncbi:MAG: hypothetical protein Q7S53_01995 [bacterium]|nr:hypothetical protein [bacterium]
MDWYNQHGYRPMIPENFGRETSDKEIVRLVGKEYKDNKYVEVSKELYGQYLAIEEAYIGGLKRTFGNTISTDFEVILTKYGMGGSYSLPNKIIINICFIRKPLIKIVIHEICHLMIETDILKYGILQREKERVVDLILNSEKFSFLNYDWWQDSYDGTEKYIDDLFEKGFFKSPEKFFKKISSVRNK